MSNELGTIIEKRLGDLGWSLARLIVESGVSPDEIVGLVGPEQLSSMPHEATLVAISESLDLSYRDLVLAAAVACGLPKSQEGEPVFVLRHATNDQLMAELRRRLVRGRSNADAGRRRLAHLALMQHALVMEAS
jgi:hypothetical protein